MRRDVKERELRSLPLFRGCSQRELHLVGRASTVSTVEAGKVLCEQGTAGYEMFVIIEGRASVTVDGADLATVGPGDAFGEMSLVDRSARMATVTALTPMRLLSIDRREFATLLQEIPAFARGLLQASTRRLRVAETVQGSR